VGCQYNTAAGRLRVNSRSGSGFVTECDRTRCVKAGTSDLGETRVEGSKAGEQGGLSYTR